MNCRGNVQILRQHSQTTSTVFVLWMKYKTVEFFFIRRVGVDVTPLGMLKFIVSFDGNYVFSNLKVGLQILLTVSISVAVCERSFSEMKLIMTYLRSTVTEGRLANFP